MGNRINNQQKRKQNAFIYIIQCCDNNGYVKIGVTTDSALNRCANLQVGCPYELKVIASFHVERELKEVEAILHKQLEDFCVRGEWFALDATKAIQFITASLPLIDETFKGNVTQDEKGNVTKMTIDGKITPDKIKRFMRQNKISQNKIAADCEIPKSSMSLFMNLRQPLSGNKASRLHAYICKNGSTANKLT
jgi:predicted XRE-type DNA-binding protein